jgi:hypothetical protein
VPGEAIGYPLFCVSKREGGTKCRVSPLGTLFLRQQRRGWHEVPGESKGADGHIFLKFLQAY